MYEIGSNHNDKKDGCFYLIVHLCYKKAYSDE